MDEETNHTEQPEKLPHVVAPPIFGLFEYLRRQPMLLGAIIGAVLGLVAANYFEIRPNLVVVGGAVAGLVVAAIVAQLRS